MEQEEILRKEAVRLHLEGLSISSICEQLNRTRQWVYKWLKKYEESSSKEWYKSGSNSPKHIRTKTKSSLEQTVIEIRLRLSNQIYAQKGAISILYEFERLGIEPPSISTINRILRRNNLIEKSKVKRLKTAEYPNDFSNVQQMDLVGPRYLKGGFRFYFYNIIDTETHFGGVYPIPDKTAESIVPCMLDFWRNYQLPDFLQMDNELSFRGSNRYPRGLGLLTRAALCNGVTPIFIPPAEPWRNGIIEKFNNNVQKYFYNTQTFTSFEDLQKRAKEFTVFHNEKHRYSSQSNRTPQQMAAGIYNKISLKKEIDLTKKIFVEEGKLVFIRFIKSDLRLKLLNESFPVKPALKYTYVVVEIILEK
ncbi:MAG: helix-turn-helix domain-containing protein [Bacteroidales bacterium]|jgi:transposase InsO family protein|nr:helix-turn-helix domain-containing protein [Bacteroidales bacterium]